MSMPAFRMWRWACMLFLAVVFLALAPRACSGKKKKGAAGKTGDAAIAAEGAGGRCPTAQGSLEQLLKAGEKEFTRNPGAAEDCYQRALLADGSSVVAMYNLGLSQNNQRRHDDAIASFERALKLHPRYGEAHFGLGQALYDKAGPAPAQGQAANHKKLLTRAKAALKKAVEYSPQYYAAYNSLGNVYLGLQDLPGAQQAYAKVVELSPRAPEGHANLARILHATGQSPAAISAIEIAISLAPGQVALYHELAAVCKAVGQERLATRLLRTALRLAPRHAVSHYQLGEILAGTVFSDEKDIPGAMRHLTRAVALDPTMAEAYMSLGMLYWGQGKMHRARDLLRSSI